MGKIIKLERMKKVAIYQNTKECYFWTKEELGYLESNHRAIFSPSDNNRTSFIFKDYEIMFIKYRMDSIIYNGLDEIYDINVLVIERTGLLEHELRKILNSIIENPQSKFVIVAKNVEDFFLTGETRFSDMILKEMEQLDNLTVIWDVDGVYYKNFHFEPKVTFHNYYNNVNFPGFMFINGGGIFHSIVKDKRIGLHLNKITDKVRQWLNYTLHKNTHTNLFYTHKETRELNNIDSCIFDNEFINPNNPSPNETWYHRQFIELTTKSDMEVVYETFTTNTDHRYLLKWNEKTIKLLFLSKPFIHADPVAHSLFKPHNLKPYRSLYTDELWEMYERCDNQKLLHINRSESEMYWKDALKRNIEWLLDMDEVEWKERLSTANELAKENRRCIEEYIFNQSLFKYVEE